MSGSFDSDQLAFLLRIVDLVVADAQVSDADKALIAARVIGAAERGVWDVDALMAAGKGRCPDSMKRPPAIRELAQGEKPRKSPGPK